MAAFNWINHRADCPGCARHSLIRCQTLVAASFDGDTTGRFCDRTYEVGKPMAWWSPDDPRFGSWRVNGRRDETYDSPDTDEEACYANCEACGAELFVVIRFRPVIPISVVRLGLVADWPSEYFQ
jgi:hypothetical protein